MAPPKKMKKTKRKSKDSSKCANPFSAPKPTESQQSDNDWWYSFWHKNSDSGPLIPLDEDEAFKYFFRVSKTTFEYICSIVRQDLVSRPPSGLINIEGRLLSVEKQVAIAMRRLASGEAQVSVGAAFGVGQSTVSQVTWRFIESMEERARHHLQWPEPGRMERIKSVFETKFGLPNCCGAIDATHIIMTLPAVESSHDWCDRESNYSMFLQVIVDHEMRFLDIVTGWPGSMTMSRLLKCSGFYKLCENGNRLNGPCKVSAEGAEIREFIIGDSAYPLLPWLMIPYVGKGISAPMAGFNEKHRDVNLLATRALAQLKGVWRILSKVMWRPDKHKLPNNHDNGYKEQNCQQMDSNGQAMRESLSRHLNWSMEETD